MKNVTLALKRFYRWFFFRARGDSPFKRLLIHLG